MRYIDALLVLSLLFIIGCSSEKGSEYIIYRRPDTTTVISNKGAFMYIQLGKDTATQILPEKAWIEGQLFKQTEDTVLRTGHCWSQTITKPTLEESDGFTSILGGGIIDDGFIINSELTDLFIVTEYYVRSYVITTNDTGYNPNVCIFKTEAYEDLWWPVDSIYPEATFMTGRRKDAVAFTLNNKGYVGTGHVGQDSKSDFWEFNPADGTWSQLSDFGGGKRHKAVGFALTNGKAYVGTGVFSGTLKNDIWEYSPTTDGWRLLDDESFPGGVIKDAIAFSIGDRGFVGLGDGGTASEIPKAFIFEFNPEFADDPVRPAWRKMTDFAGGARTDAVAFTIGYKAYVGTGKLGSTYYNDMYEFDPGDGASGGAWVKISAMPGDARVGAVGFPVCEYGYVGTGENQSGDKLRDFYMYDPYNKLWVEDVAWFNGEPVSDAFGFGICDGNDITRGYIGAGENQSGNFSNEFREYLPYEKYLPIKIDGTK